MKNLKGIKRIKKYGLQKQVWHKGKLVHVYDEPNQTKKADGVKPSWFKMDTEEEELL